MISTSSAFGASQRKQIRYCSLIRILCWPLRLPRSRSSLFPGGIASCRSCWTRLIWSSLRRATCVGQPPRAMRDRRTLRHGFRHPQRHPQCRDCETTVSRITLCETTAPVVNPSLLPNLVGICHCRRVACARCLGSPNACMSCGGRPACRCGPAPMPAGDRRQLYAVVSRSAFKASPSAVSGRWCDPVGAPDR